MINIHRSSLCWLVTSFESRGSERMLKKFVELLSFWGGKRLNKMGCFVVVVVVPEMMKRRHRGGEGCEGLSS